MKWKDGGKRSDGWQCERFDDEDSAKVFRDAVDEAGQHWPPGWVKGKGYIDPTAADELRYRFDRWAVESVESRTASKRYKQQRIRALEMYMFPTFGNCDIRSAEHFSKDTIGAWVNKMLKAKVKRGAKIKDMSPETLRGLHGLLSSVLKEAIVAEPPLRDRKADGGRRTWTWRAGGYCDSNGVLRSDPGPVYAYVQSAVNEAFPGEPLVPAGMSAGGSQVTVRTLEITNPDPCREARVIVASEVDVSFRFPVGGRAGYFVGGDEMYQFENGGSSTIREIHTQTTKVTGNTVVAPGATLTFNLPIGMGFGLNGTTYNRIQSIIRAVIFVL
ncbi:hypothetical protein ACFU8Q_28310 [Streptomyces sp. NPDC057543]|uniref:hypothetical protein n=1 Tax=Streptomyces sp. NPDC057543 TaxID=3346163 RepID=UPI00368E8F51